MTRMWFKTHSSSWHEAVPATSKGRLSSRCGCLHEVEPAFVQEAAPSGSCRSCASRVAEERRAEMLRVVSVPALDPKRQRSPVNPSPGQEAPLASDDAMSTAFAPDRLWPALLDAEQASIYCGVSKSTWWKLVSAKRVPAPVAFSGGRRMKRWRRSELDACIQTLRPVRGA